jgi:hypothetical protein
VAWLSKTKEGQKNYRGAGARSMSAEKERSGNGQGSPCGNVRDTKLPPGLQWPED